LHLLETGLQAIQLSPYRADPPARRSFRLDTTAGFLACYFPLSPFGSRVSHQIQRPLLPSLPATRAIQRCASWRRQDGLRGEVPLLRAFSAQPSSEPSGHPFDALGSPVTGGRQVPFRRSALRIPRGSLRSVTCAPSPCGPALPVSRLAGRYSCDYYGHSVAIGLAPRRRSHVHQRCMCQRDLGVPFISFNTRTGHRSSAPEDCRRFVVTLPQGPVPVSGVFPAGVLLHLLETGIQAIQLSPYHADPPARRSRRLDTTAGFLACYFPRSPFGSGSAIRSRDISSRPCPLRERYNAAPRGAATTRTAHTDHLISTRPPAALPRPLARPSSRSDATGSAVSCMSTCRMT